MLHYDAVGGGVGVSDFPKKPLPGTKMCDSTLLGGVGGCQISLKKALRRCTFQRY